MKILFATDGSTNAKACFQAMQYPSFAEPVAVHAVCVVDPKQNALLADRLNEKNADNLMQSTIAELKAASFAQDVAGEVLHGGAADKILEAAEQWQADHIYIGAHARRGWQEPLLGSVAHEVLKRSSCSTTIVRADSKDTFQGHKKRLICVDDSSATEKMLQLSARRLYSSDTVVMLLHVLVPLVSGEGSENPKLDAQMFSRRLLDRRQQMQQIMQTQITTMEKLISGGNVAGQIIEEFEVVETIINTAISWLADLIIMGSHSRQGMDKFLLGSVSEAVAVRSPCSVEVIR